MQRFMRIPAAIGLFLFISPAFAAEPIAATSVGAEPSGPIKPAESCLRDLGSFDARMEKDGFWIGGPGYGFGYPLGLWGQGQSYPIGHFGSGYAHARPSYNLRALIVAANILAQRGEQKLCEDILSETGKFYDSYLSDMRSQGMPMAKTPDWWQEQITASLPVTSSDVSFRSDQLLGANVRSRQNLTLGSVEDLITDRETGKIAYLVIARGGILGIGEKYVPVPWENFMINPDKTLLVLDTTRNAMDAAPDVHKDRFGPKSEQSVKVDAYWKAQSVSPKSSN
jgi:sporulation protein YlmC with PRC-barrel domain